MMNGSPAFGPLAWRIGVKKLQTHSEPLHKYEIMKELGLASNAELVQYAIKHSPIPPP